ncbi:MAG: PDZ domain-containing protein [Planctomycetes bacterium]|nr:PDZ domain-containing protein [Planctomycetota bacterium]
MRSTFLVAAGLFLAMAVVLAGAGCCDEPCYGRAFVRGDFPPEEAAFDLGSGESLKVSRHALLRESASGEEAAFLGLTFTRPPKALSDEHQLPLGRGAMVKTVTAGGPAARAGLRPRDLITRLDGQEVPDGGDLRMRVEEARPGTTHTLQVYRSGAAQAPLAVEVVYGAKPGSGRVEPVKAPRRRDSQHLGVEVTELPDDLFARVARKSASAGRLAVSWVEAAGPAFAGGLRVGDLLVAADEQPLPDLRAFDALLTDLRWGGPFTLRVDRAGAVRDLEIAAVEDYRDRTRVGFPFVVHYEGGYNCSDLRLILWGILFHRETKTMYEVLGEHVTPRHTGEWSVLAGMFGREVRLDKSSTRLFWFIDIETEKK